MQNHLAPGAAVLVQFPSDQLIPARLAGYQLREGVVTVRVAEELWAVTFPYSGLEDETFPAQLLTLTTPPGGKSRAEAARPAVIAYTFLQPVHKVVSRKPVPGAKYYWEETLECGHVLSRQRAHKRKGKPHYLPDGRRCPLCPPDPPPLAGVTVVLDETLPYEPGEGRKPGFQYVNRAGRVSLRPTDTVRMHPAYYASLPEDSKRRQRLARAVVERPWACHICGKRGKNPGGRVTHYRARHGTEPPGETSTN